jgi:hypothetical protein
MGEAQEPDPAGAKSAALRSMFCLSQGACWAVGASTKQGSTSPDSTLAAHWNGTRWSIVPTP